MPRQSVMSSPAKSPVAAKRFLRPCSCRRKPIFLSVAASCSSTTTLTPDPTVSAKENGSFWNALRPTTSISPLPGRVALASTMRTPIAARTGAAVPSGSKRKTFEDTFAFAFAGSRLSENLSDDFQPVAAHLKPAAIVVVSADAANAIGMSARPPGCTVTLPLFFVPPAFQTHSISRGRRESLRMTSDFSTFSPGRNASFTRVNSFPAGPAIQPRRSVYVSLSVLPICRGSSSAWSRRPE